ncbi:hypothetical protein V2S66_21305 [Streptomyces sp. V4-01]|uniref:Uncharacterized protein n=1 Tax=Actinacidiphila polyblastidii TaxID=3110430 RepID=A0ABU7PGS6_9ACTN|nr:hypothetical protein [Streptomyces sp. V4-01]
MSDNVEPATLLVRSFPNVLSLRGEPNEPQMPREKSFAHIRNVLLRNGLQDFQTVGSDIAATIEALWLVAGEHGARRIDTYFMDRANDTYYTAIKGTPAYDTGMQAMALGEAKRWATEHSNSPSAGTEFATNLTVPQRIEMTKLIGNAFDVARRFEHHGRAQGDSFGGPAISPSELRSSVAGLMRPVSGLNSSGTASHRTPAGADQVQTRHRSKGSGHSNGR